MPAAAVIRRVRALSGITGRKGRVGGPCKRAVKARGSTPGRPCGLRGWSTVGADGIPGVAVECVEIRKNTGGEGGLLGRNRGDSYRVSPSADAEARQRGEQTGLDTLVVHAVNDGH